MDKVSQYAQGADSPVERYEGQVFGLRAAYQRSADSLASGQPGQDYLEWRLNDNQLAFAVCDGVGQSCFGDIAARELGIRLADWFASIGRLSELEEGNWHNRLQDSLAGWAVEAHTQVLSREIPASVPDMVRGALENLRDSFGSQAVFLAGLMEVDASKKMNVVLIGAGDILVRWVAGNGNAQAGETGSDGYGPTGYWSSLRGLVGQHRWIVLPDIGRLVVCSDGLADWADRLLEMSDVAVESAMQEQLYSPRSDDISLLDIWRVDQSDFFAPRRIETDIFAPYDESESDESWLDVLSKGQEESQAITDESLSDKPELEGLIGKVLAAVLPEENVVLPSAPEANEETFIPRSTEESAYNVPLKDITTETRPEKTQLTDQAEDATPVLDVDQQRDSHTRQSSVTEEMFGEKSAGEGEGGRQQIESSARVSKPKRGKKTKPKTEAMQQQASTWQTQAEPEPVDIVQDLGKPADDTVKKKSSQKVSDDFPLGPILETKTASTLSEKELVVGETPNGQKVSETELPRAPKETPAIRMTVMEVTPHVAIDKTSNESQAGIEKNHRAPSAVEPKQDPLEEPTAERPKGTVEGSRPTEKEEHKAFKSRAPAPPLDHRASTVTEKAEASVDLPTDSPEEVSAQKEEAKPDHRKVDKVSQLNNGPEAQPDVETKEQPVADQSSVVPKPFVSSASSSTLAGGELPDPDGIAPGSSPRTPDIRSSFRSLFQRVFGFRLKQDLIMPPEPVSKIEIMIECQTSEVGRAVKEVLQKYHIEKYSFSLYSQGASKSPDPIVHGDQSGGFVTSISSAKYELVILETDTRGPRRELTILIDVKSPHHYH